MSGVQHLLGKLIEGVEQRDAIHVAVAPVKAEEKLWPGQHVGFAIDGDCETVSSRAKPIGLIDPYLGGPVQPGERCWLFLYPGTATVLRHDWAHPAFVAKPQEPPQKRLSEAWLRAFGEANDCPYDMLLDAAKNYLESGAYLIQGGRWEGNYTPDEFWPHYEVVTGTHVPESDWGSFFSCGC